MILRTDPVSEMVAAVLSDTRQMLTGLASQWIGGGLDPIADVRTAPDPRIFHPGDGRAFYGGISWSW
jgi:hypothetical protein